MEDLGRDGRIILKCSFQKWDEVGWINLCQDRDKCRAVVDTVV